MALKGNPFEKDTFRPPLPITGTRPKPKFEKIELGAVPSAPPVAPENKSQIEKAQNDSQSQVETAQSPTAKTEQFDDKKQDEINRFVLNGEQSVNKQITIGERTVNKPETIGEQSVNKQITIGGQKKETVNKRLSKRGTSQLTNGKQKVNNRLTKISFFELIGLQKKLAVYVYNSCKLTRSDISGPISLQSLAENLKSTAGSVKTTAKRLRQKGIITTVDQKEGRGGFTKYRLNDAIYNEILQDESVNNQLTNGEQTVDKRLPKRGTERGTSPSSSSILSYSSDLKENTNTSKALNLIEKDKKESGPDPIWGEIDFSGLAEIQFNKYHLRQWRDRKYCSPQEAQESIWHFEYDYKHHFSSDSKKKALSILMGTVAKSKYYARPDGYQSPEEITQQIRLKSEERRAYQEESVLNKLFEAKFQIWFNSQTGNTIKALSQGVSTFEAKKSLVRQKFQDEHWFTVKENPDVDPITLNIPIQEVAAAHPSESARNQNPIGLPVKQLSELDLAREKCVSEVEAIRQLEEVIEKEPKESLRTSFRSQIGIHKKKLEKLFTEFPKLKEEKRLIDEAMESLGKSNS
ncbi:MAG: hypothetical protein ABIQ95_10520 [Bdellovibrionia bacterium]